jgi:FRG domain
VERIRISTWLHLQEELFGGAWQEELGRFRSDFAFRGEADARAEQRTSLVRLGGPYGDVEAHLLRNFRKYAGLSAIPVDSLWNWLALAKHHGLPTRLLGWTFSPYVALHFATASPRAQDADGAVWWIDFVGANRRLPAGLRRLLEEEGANTFTADMLGRVAPSLKAFDVPASTDEFVVFFEPPSLDERFVNQAALFALMPTPRAQLGEWLRAIRILPGSSSCPPS